MAVDHILAELKALRDARLPRRRPAEGPVSRSRDLSEQEKVFARAGCVPAGRTKSLPPAIT